MATISLNDVVRFKLTDRGKYIYYHRYDKMNRDIIAVGGKPILPGLPKVDADGYSSMQLWDFINLYGKYIYMGAPAVIEPLTLIFEEE